MGRIITERNIIQENILQHLRNTYTSDNKRLQGTPIYVTYFNKNLAMSEQDRTLETVKEVLGAESPLSYNQIDNFPLYLVNEINPNLDLDEYGLNTSGQGEAVILPNTIKPYIDDMISIDYMEENILFRVTNVEIDRLNGKKFYKIQFELSQYKKEEVNEKVDANYETEYENIGTNFNPIIERSEYILIEKINEVIDFLRKFYINTFMNKKYNILIYRYNDKEVYNEFLIKFILNNQILKNTKRKLLSSYYIQDIFKDSLARTELYHHTIYYALEKQNKDLFEFENLITMKIPKDFKESPFALDWKEYYRVFYVDGSHFDDVRAELDKTYDKYKKKNDIMLKYDDVFGKQHNSSYQFISDYFPEYELDNGDNPKTKAVYHIKIIPHDNIFVANVKNNILYGDNNEYFYENIIIRYFNNCLDINKDFLSDILEHNNFPSFKGYLLIPCIIFILKNKINELTEK